MYKRNKPEKTTLTINTSYEGERLEEKINRIVNNKEPITDGAPLIYTDRKDGVRPDTNIRTDRFEIAVDAMDKVHKSSIAKREAFHKDLEDKNKEIQKKKDGGPESIQATDTK
jgi:hypothetical protein